jgi:PAS domain S-box-containing protein
MSWAGATDGGEMPPAEVFEQLVEGTTNYAQFMLDRDGTIVEWFTGGETLYGYAPDTAIGKPLMFLFAESEYEPALESLLPGEGEEPIDEASWHKRADDSVFWASFTISRLSNGTAGRYAVIAHDTTAKKQYEQMLERQNDRLKEFTDILSHDLRSPLSVAAGHLSLYEQTGEQEHLETIDDTLTRMGTLVDDLLSVARQGQVVTNPSPTDIESVIEVAREGTLPASATLEYQPVPKVMADRNRLLQVFENLFRNSVDHGSETVTVRVGLLEDGFYVEDDGPGIPESDRERVFNHGYTTREDGTGYGLSVVRSVIGAHGWDIAVSDSDGGGARFEITGIKFVSDD